MEKEKHPVFRYGQLLISKEPVEIEKFGGEKVIVPAGNKVVVGFDGFAHHLKNEFIQPFTKNTVLKGFCCDGVVETIYQYLNARFPLDDMLSDYDLTENDFREDMAYALEEIGMNSYTDWSKQQDKDEED